jgi:single-strand DNA-binding protein
MYRNKFEVAGNLGMNPEIKNLEGGKKVVKFSLAETSGYYDEKKQFVENTQWHNIEAWGKLAERIETKYSKGDNVFIDGRIKYNSWEDQEGKKHFSTVVVVESISTVSKAKREE